MAIIKCERGHFFDDEKYESCPMCNRGGSGDDGDVKTMALFSSIHNDDEKTIGINFKKTNCDPVVGWLICVDGPEKGRDFRIHSGRNFIGRDMTNDIYLTEDASISRKNEGYLIYEPRSNSFIVMNGEGASIYVNDEPISEPTKIKDYDRVSIGSYVFDFIAYCKGDKKW